MELQWQVVRTQISHAGDLGSIFCRDGDKKGIQPCSCAPKHLSQALLPPTKKKKNISGFLEWEVATTS